MEVEILSQPARRVVGMTVRTANSADVPPLWDRFIPRMKEVPIEGECFGVARWNENLPDGQFAYLAGFESSQAPPEGMEAWDLPASEYARVTIGGLDEIRPTIDWFHQEWLPTSGFKRNEAPFLEHYPEEFPTIPTLHLLFSIEKA
jgi:predicted transcriptional regulator YdeE